MRVSVLLFPLLFAGCVMGDEAPANPSKGLAHVPQPPMGSCGADELQGLVGQPASVLETMRFSQVVRVIHPGMAVTMDYSPERLNIDVDEAKTISRVSCG